MKKSIKRIITALVVLFALIGASVTAYAAVNYGGAQDAQQSKERISLIAGMFKRKDDKIKTLENEKKDFNKQLDNFNKQLDDKNKVIADKDKTIADKEREKVQLENIIVQKENTIIQKENEITNLKGSNEALKQELDNKVKTYKEQLEQAEKDLKEINNLLGDVVNENEGE